MNKVRVGVKRIKNGDLAKQGGDADHSFQQAWVEINGVRLNADLVRAEWGPANGPLDSGNAPMVVRLTLFCSDFESVDAREESPGGHL